MAKKRPVQVSFTEDQRHALKRAAERDAMTVAAWIRHTVLRAAEWEPPSPKTVDSFKPY